MNWRIGLATRVLRICIAALAVMLGTPVLGNATCRPEDELPKTLVEAEARLRQADETLATARQAVEQAKQAVADASDEQKMQEEARELASAKEKLRDALKETDQALADHDCVRDLLMNARTWRYGILGGLHGSTDATGVEKAGAQLEFVWHAYHLWLPRESVIRARWSRVRTSDPGSQHWAEAAVLLGQPFGANGTLVFGPGLAGRVDEWNDDSQAVMAATAELGVGLRFGQWLRQSNWTGLGEARVFMQPWIPLGKSEPVTVHFGVELSFGVAGSRIGESTHLTLGNDGVEPEPGKPGAPTPPQDPATGH